MNREGRRKNLDAAAAGATSDAWAASAQPLLGLGLKCLHYAPVALVPLIIRWGAENLSRRADPPGRLAPRPDHGPSAQKL